jgi:hypothetical protein
MGKGVVYLEALWSRRKLCAVDILIIVVMTVMLPVLMGPVVLIIVPVVGLSIHHVGPGNHYRRWGHDYWGRLDKHGTRRYDYPRRRGHHDGKRQAQPNRDMHSSCLRRRG